MNPDLRPQPVALVVDDEELLPFVAANILQEKGFTTLEAADADEALKLLESGLDKSGHGEESIDST